MRDLDQLEALARYDAEERAERHRELLARDEVESVEAEQSKWDGIFHADPYKDADVHYRERGLLPPDCRGPHDG